MVLETQKLVQLLFISITTSVPNFIIFLLTVHRAAIDFHLRKKNNNNNNNNKKTNRYNRCLALRAWPLIRKLTDTIGASAPSGLGP